MPAPGGGEGLPYMPKRIERVDVLVGQRVRAIRLARGMSQTALAEKVGVTFQQIQKYEKGVNRIGSGRLKRVATVLGVGIASLFGDEESERPAHDPLTEILAQPLSARLLQAFAGIADVKLRLSLLKLAEGLAERTK